MPILLKPPVNPDIQLEHIRIISKIEYEIIVIVINLLGFVQILKLKLSKRNGHII